MNSLKKFDELIDYSLYKKNNGFFHLIESSGGYISINTSPTSILKCKKEESELKEYILEKLKFNKNIKSDISYQNVCIMKQPIIGFKIDNCNNILKIRVRNFKTRKSETYQLYISDIIAYDTEENLIFERDIYLDINIFYLMLSNEDKEKLKMLISI